jgi:DNA-binding response OmpR family regulator
MHEFADHTRRLATGNGGSRRSQPTILCVDDDSEISRIWQIRLSRHGMDVVCAANGTAGFAAALEHSPDLILLDLCMPGEDGHQVLARLRCHPQTRAIPVLMLTGGDAAAARRQTLDGADDYLTKPLNFAELLVKLEAHLPASRTSDSSHRPLVGQTVTTPRPDLAAPDTSHRPA